MSRSDFTALVTEPAAEYRACIELERFGLRPYLPQLKRRWIDRSGYFTARLYPLFPSYLLIPIGDANHTAVRLAPGVRKVRPLLTSAEGRPWRCPEEVVTRIMQAEARGDFDEMAPARGDKMMIKTGALAGMEALMEQLSGTRAQLFVALLGGARVSVAAAKVVRA